MYTRAMIRVSPHVCASAGCINGLSVWVDFRMNSSVLSCEEACENSSADESTPPHPRAQEYESVENQ